jgi:lipopolysaccharide/colanic/teichoic acid biosynthesis glycosyltransferase
MPDDSELALPMVPIIVDSADSTVGALQSHANKMRLYTALKRTLDVVGAAIGLLLLLPLLLAAAIAIRLETPGPAIFRQTRVGLNGRTFTLVKFRGMFADARERFPEHYRYDHRQDQAQDLRFHQTNDPRVTRVGQFLRRTSVDELPNLINVLMGQMSLVGPRPEIPEMLPYYGAAQALVLSVKPGITCLSKITGRDELTLAETIAADLDYVRRRSISLDLEILARTVVVVVRQDGIA